MLKMMVAIIIDNMFYMEKQEVTEVNSLRWLLRLFKKYD